MSRAQPTSVYICLAAGGTGGHVMPAISIAEKLLADGHQILLLTDKRGAKLIPSHLSCKVASSASPFAGSKIKRVAALFQLAAGLAKCLLTLAVKRPAVMVGFGGYPAAAPIFAAWCLGIPAVMHEQNAVIGRTNLMLARFTKALLASWPENKNLPASTPVIHTGLPVRTEFTTIPPYRSTTDSAPFRLAIFGGSLGAALFADIIPAALASLPASLRNRLIITQQVRHEQKEALDKFYQQHGIAAETSSFFANVADIMAQSDLLISRSGASSVAEIACAGRAAILIPFAGALDNHQQANAEQLCAHDAGILLTETQANAQTLADKIAEVMGEDDLRLTLARNARNQAQTGAIKAITDHILSYDNVENKEAA